MKISQVTTERQTKYCTAIQAALANRGHATNQELLTVLREIYPTLSATTVHRATARLAARGRITIAPAAKDGSIRYDANMKAHDHFLCNMCGTLRDTDVKTQVTPILEAAINGCSISGRLTISGVCVQCKQQGVRK